MWLLRLAGRRFVFRWACFWVRPCLSSFLPSFLLLTLPRLVHHLSRSKETDQKITPSWAFWMSAVKEAGAFVQVGMGSPNVQIPISAFGNKQAKFMGSFRYGAGDYVRFSFSLPAPSLVVSFGLPLILLAKVRTDSCRLALTSFSSFFLFLKPTAIHLVSSGAVKLAPLITHRTSPLPSLPPFPPS